MDRKDLYKILKQLSSLPENSPKAIEQLEDDVRDFWIKARFNVDAVEMALKYAHGRADNRLRGLTEEIRDRAYPVVLAQEIENADSWLHSLRGVTEETP